MKTLCFVFLLCCGYTGLILAESNPVNPKQPEAAVSQPSPSARHDEPVRVEVGDSTVSGSYLKPCTNLWKLTQQKPGEPAEEVGTWSDSLENTTYQGHPAIKRTQIANYSKKRVQLTFVSIFDPKTMESFSFDYSRSDNGNLRHADFRRETVTYSHADTIETKPEETTVKLDRPVFDFYGGVYGLFVSTLPLADRYNAEIPAFDTDKMAVD